jgi:hypothetical protein
MKLCLLEIVVRRDRTSELELLYVPLEELVESNVGIGDSTGLIELHLAIHADEHSRREGTHAIATLDGPRIDSHREIQLKFLNEVLNPVGLLLGINAQQKEGIGLVIVKVSV